MQRVNSAVLLIGFWIVLLGNGFPTLAAIFYRNREYNFVSEVTRG